LLSGVCQPPAGSTSPSALNDNDDSSRTLWLDSGSPDRFIERILTVHATLRQQRRNVLDFVRHACEAALLGIQGPSLLPQAHAASSLDQAA
jgi:hypothetical protein